MDQVIGFVVRKWEWVSSCKIALFIRIFKKVSSNLMTRHIVAKCSYQIYAVGIFNASFLSRQFELLKWTLLYQQRCYVFVFPRCDTRVHFFFLYTCHAAQADWSMKPVLENCAHCISMGIGNL